MELTKDRLLYLETKALQKKNKKLLETLHGIPALIQLVQPALVIHFDDLPKEDCPSVWAFAKNHGYDYQKLLRLLQKENVLHKEHGTWVLESAYRNAGLAVYAIGRKNRYRCLDLYLLPAGEEFMLAFMKAHPTLKRNKKTE